MWIAREDAPSFLLPHPLPSILTWMWEQCVPTCFDTGLSSETSQVTRHPALESPLKCVPLMLHLGISPDASI